MTKTNLFRVSIANFASFAGHLFFPISRIQAAVGKHATRVHLRNPRRIRTFVRMAEPLSPRHQQLLDFIADWSAAQGRPPTLLELAAQLGLRQHTSAQVHVEALIRKVWLPRGSQHAILPFLASAQTPRPPQ